jgi:hypothetical protein
MIMEAVHISEMSRLHGGMSQKVDIFILAAMRIRNLMITNVFTYFA